MTPERSAQWTRRLQAFRAAYERACRAADWPKARKAQALRERTYDRWAADVWAKRKTPGEHPVEDAFDIGSLAGPWGRAAIRTA